MKRFKEKFFERMYVVGMIAVLMATGGYILLKPQQTYSQNENRYLEEIPSFSFADYRVGNFQKKMEKGVADQFPARDFWTESSTEFRKIMGMRDVGDVYLGKDHYFFSKVQEKDLSLEQYEKNLSAVKRFSDKYNNVRVMLIPSPAVILQDKLPRFATIYDAQTMYRQAENILGEHLVDVRSRLKNEAAHSQVYFRTDHHWTHKGAYAAYCCYEENCAREPMPEEMFSYQVVSEDFYGTMFSRALDRQAVPDRIAIPQIPEHTVVMREGELQEFYVREQLHKKDQYAVYLGGNYPVITIKNSDNESGRKLLMVKDSFANSLVPLLLYDFSEITMIDLRYENRAVEKMVEEQSWDEILVLYEMSNFALSRELLKLG